MSILVDPLEDNTLDPLLRDWLSTYKTADKRAKSKYYYNFYQEYTGKTPQRLLDQKDQHPTDGYVEKQIIAFKQWLKDEKSKTESVVFNARITVSAFYSFHRRPLKFRPGEIRAPKPVKSDFPLTLAHVQGCLMATSLRGKALFSVAVSTGLREGDVLRMKRGDIEPFLNNEPPVAFWDENGYFTEKEGEPSFPFLHATAVRYLKEYLATHDSEWLFPTNQGNHLSRKECNRMFVTAFKNAGFKAGNKRVRFHSLRKFFIGRAQDAGLETNVWKLLCGKHVAERTYSTNQLREAFLRVAPKLDPEALQNNHARVKDLEAQVQRLTEAYERLEKKKGLEAMMEMYKKMQSSVLKETLAKNVPVAAINGKEVTPGSLKISAEEILTLKAWASTLLQWYVELEDTDVELLPAGKAWLRKIIRTLKQSET